MREIAEGGIRLYERQGEWRADFGTGYYVGESLFAIVLLIRNTVVFFRDLDCTDTKIQEELITNGFE